eukprot:5881663-Pleurochrysis_carterae.AAC.5
MDMGENGERRVFASTRRARKLRRDEARSRTRRQSAAMASASVHSRKPTPERLQWAEEQDTCVGILQIQAPAR